MARLGGLKEGFPLIPPGCAAQQIFKLAVAGQLTPSRSKQRYADGLLLPSHSSKSFSRNIHAWISKG
jgi:hypothetical protein